MTSPAPLPAAAAVIGVDGCRAGWVGVHWSDDDAAAVLVAGTMLELVGGLVAAHGPVDVVGVDIPLHLPTDAPRAAEREARRRLPGRASTVFGSPSSAAIDAPDYAEANRLNRAHNAGGSLFLAWNLRKHSNAQLLEGHPGLSIIILEQ